MAQDSQTPQDYFRLILLTVVGQAYEAGGFDLQEQPLKWAGGQFRFKKALSDDLNAFIDYQLLAYVDTEWSAGMPSRFRVMLTRTDKNDPLLSSEHDEYVQKDLSNLVVEDFKVAILPSANHWWTFKSTDELGKALAEAGHLVVGYGMPWLSGDLDPTASA